MLIASLAVTTAAYAQPTQLDCAFAVYDPALEMHSTTFETCEGDGFYVDMHQIGNNFYAFVSAGDKFAHVDLVNVRKQVVQLPVASGLGGWNLIVERVPDGPYAVSVVSPD